MLDSIKSLKELIYPKLCLSCNAYGAYLCPICTLIWVGKTKVNQISGHNLYFTCCYDASASGVLLAAKESGNKAARKIIANSITNSIIFAISNCLTSSQISIITIPSTASSIRRRGIDHVGELAKQVCLNLVEQNIDAHFLPILYANRNLQDQSDLNSEQRTANIKGAYGVRACENPANSNFLIDDLITTGASIKEGIRALSQQGIPIAAVVTACAVGRNSLIR